MAQEELAMTTASHLFATVAKDKAMREKRTEAVAIFDELGKQAKINKTANKSNGKENKT